MVDISKVRAIDIHTHAEEPCGCHPDDGYDELQSTMANISARHGSIRRPFRKLRRTFARRMSQP